VKLLDGVQQVKVLPGQSRADRPEASVASRRATGGCEAYTARKQAAKIELRNWLRCEADAVCKVEGCIRSPANARALPESPESLDRGMLPKGFPRNPGELPIPSSPWEVPGCQGRPKALGIDGRAVLEAHSTGEGGEPQGSRKGRPRYPLEGRGGQTDVSVEGNIAET
jgi:hypothetical protein